MSANLETLFGFSSSVVKRMAVVIRADTVFDQKTKKNSSSLKEDVHLQHLR